MLIIPLGLASRAKGLPLPALVKDFGGDVLYATMIFFVARFIAPAVSLFKIGLIAYFICVVIECLQLYDALWMEKLRHTFPFGLILGYGFVWSDLICYAVGVLLALIPAMLIERKRQIN